LAYGEDVTVAPRTPPQTQGLWLVLSTGGTPRRLLQPPRPLEGNHLGIGPVAWSPDRYTLAYAVNPGGGVMNASRPEPALGIWLTRYDHVHPRLLVTFAQLGAVDAPPLQAPFVINQLSWSPDGRSLAVSTFRRLPGASQPEQPVAVILAVDTATGAVRMLVSGAQDAVFAPLGAALAYTASGSGPAGGGTLQVADAQGRHGHVLPRGPISSPAWAPDGRTLAYIDGGTAIRTVAVATGQTRVVLTISAQGLPPRRTVPSSGVDAYPRLNEVASVRRPTLRLARLPTGAPSDAVKSGIHIHALAALRLGSPFFMRMVKGFRRRLDAEHGALPREGREGIGQRRRILRQAVQTLEELNAVRHLAGECAQDGGALRDGELDEDDPLLLTPAGQDAPTGRPRVFDPIGPAEPTDDVPLAVHRQRGDGCAAQLAARAARHREHVHGADGQAEAL
jgi:hypothetical protein